MLDLAPLVYFINEREAIRLRKVYLEAWEAGRPYPHEGDWKGAWHGGHLGPVEWSLDRLTDDPFLSKFRFCNVERAKDRVSLWLQHNIWEPLSEHELLWFAAAIGRYINWPPAVQELMDWGAWPANPDFKPSDMTAVLELRKSRGEKVEGGAFMTRAESDKNAPHFHWSKQRYVCEVVLGKLWEFRHWWSAALVGKMLERQPTLQEVWETLQNPRWRGYGPFTAYQLVIDLRWTRYLRDAPDIQTWAALGPGSARGLNRLHGRPTDSPLSQAQGLDEMLEVRARLSEPGVLAEWVVLPDLSDVQNCLCETDKMLRVRNGEGRPRALWVPGRGY
jgi:hypothetical protein